MIVRRLLLAALLVGCGDSEAPKDHAAAPRATPAQVPGPSDTIQNLLLVLTARGLGNYWSSGGFFRTRVMFEKLGIDTRERLLGAVFVDYGAPESEVEIISGKQRDNRSEASSWTRVIELDLD